MLFFPAFISAAAGKPLELLIFPLICSEESVSAWIGEGVALSLSSQLADAETRAFSRGETEDLLTEHGLPIGVPLSRGSMIFIAEQADADFVIMGSYTESGDTLKLSVRLLDMKTMTQGSEFTISGTIVALPGMENELAWMIYSSIAGSRTLSREEFRGRMRQIPNSAYASYIESINAFDENRQLQLLEKAVREYVEFAEARFKIGQLYYQKRDYIRALPHIEYGLKLPNERLQSEFLIGTCRLQLGETARAIEDYRQFISQSQHTAAMNNLAVAYARSGENVLALRVLTEAWTQDRDDSAIAINLVIARYLVGAAPAAMKFIEEAITVYPGNGMLHFLSSFLMKEAGNEAQASADMARAAKFGIDVDRLLREEPKTWMRIILYWTNEE